MKIIFEKEKKGDRCTRIAKRKYDVWPSAYASGAVVKCRQGKIWKGLSEEQLTEEILNIISEDLGISVNLCADSHLCCGSAGTYSILQADLSEQLRSQKLANLS